MIYILFRIILNMEFDSDKVLSLINKYENSLSGFALKIGMSHSGLKSGLINGTLGIKRLIKIASYFNKPIEYFFTSDKKYIVEDNYTEYKTTPTSPGNDICTNPECIAEKAKLKDEKIALLEELKQLYKENARLLEEQKGEGHKGKSLEGGVEEPLADIG